MDEPITWLALQAIRDLISGITRAAGFRTDLGAGTILTDRARLTLEQGAVTLIVAGEIESSDGSASRRVQNNSMDIAIEYAIPFDDESPELMAHRARADIIKALSTDLRAGPRCFNSIEVTGSRFLSDADEKGIPFTLAQVTARAGLTETQAPAQ